MASPNQPAPRAWKALTHGMSLMNIVEWNLLEMDRFCSSAWVVETPRACPKAGHVASIALTLH